MGSEKSVRRVKALVAGNWKMNGLKESKREIRRLAKKLDTGGKPKCDVLICPPATLIGLLREEAKGTGIAIGGQDCHAKASGAHTGDIAAAMLRDAGADYVIVGHSERRTDHHETDEMVKAKAEAAWEADLVAIICVGETGDERKAGETLAVVGRQVTGSVPEGAMPKNMIIAYEPVWAIGTGLTPTAEDVAVAHGHIRSLLTERFPETGKAFRILYGGSVKPGNAAELMAVPNVNGALVGGASLTADDFYGIISAAYL